MSRSPDWSPWRTLAVGVAVGVCTIAGIGVYTYSEVRRLRDEQTAISERNRKDSLQLLRIQNDWLGSAVLMRDMVEGQPIRSTAGGPPSIGCARDLAEATRLEQALAPAVARPAQQARLVQASTPTGGTSTEDVRAQPDRRTRGAPTVRSSLIPQHRAIDGMVSQFLVVNNQVQEEAARANRAVYDRVGREILRAGRRCC